MFDQSVLSNVGVRKIQEEPQASAPSRRKTVLFIDEIHVSTGPAGRSDAGCGVRRYYPDRRQRRRIRIRDPPGRFFPDRMSVSSSLTTSPT